MRFTATDALNHEWIRGAGSWLLCAPETPAKQRLREHILASTLKTQALRDKDYLMRQGEPSAFIFFVQKGIVEVFCEANLLGDGTAARRARTPIRCGSSPPACCDSTLLCPPGDTAPNHAHLSCRLTQLPHFSISSCRRFTHSVVPLGRCAAGEYIGEFTLIDAKLIEERIARPGEKKVRASLQTGGSGVADSAPLPWLNISRCVRGIKRCLPVSNWAGSLMVQGEQLRFSAEDAENPPCPIRRATCYCAVISTASTRGNATLCTSAHAHASDRVPSCARLLPAVCGQTVTWRSF